MKKNEEAEPVQTPFDPEMIKDAASDLAEKAAKFIKKHPLESVGGALVLGLVVGLWIKRK